MPSNYQNTPWTATSGGGYTGPVLINGPVGGSAGDTGATANRGTSGAVGFTGNPGLNGSTGAGSDGSAAGAGNASAVVPSGKPQGTINSTTGANVRYGPGMDYTVLCIADHGTLLTILETKSGSDGSNWYRVTLPDGREGFIRQDLVTLKK
nr:SH3 domain-containing protein [Heliobacterium chlorum]